MKLLKSKREKFLLVVAIVITLWMAVKYLYVPRVDKIKELSGELKLVSIELEAFEKLLEQKKQEEDVSRKLSRLKTKFIKEGNINEVLHFITDASKRAKTNLVSINPKQIKIEKFYRTVPIDIKLNGKYNDIMDFLGSIDRYEKIIDVMNIQVKKDEIKRGMLKAELVGNVYVMK